MRLLFHAIPTPQDHLLSMIKLDYKAGGTVIEQFKDRLKILNAQLQQAQNRLQQANADVIAISGALQEVGYWIKQLKEKEADEVDSK